MNRIYLTALCSLWLCRALHSDDGAIVNKVDHKNLQLNLYLDLIKYNTQEKLGILPYILDNPNGVYLEVGTGGDPIAELLSKIPASKSPTIIASDIDQSILNVLPVRHPQLRSYLDAKSGPKLALQQLDATSMNFEDNYLSGINASAVLHEIVSYAGGIQGLDDFFSESLRVLKPQGVLIYRDPEGACDKHEMVSVDLKTPSIRLFSHIFLCKFLDNRCGKLAHSGRKYTMYDTSGIQFSFYKKNETKLTTLSYDDYFKMRSYEIDFSRQYTICLPRGLCREIERHYLTYLHQANPLVFVKCLPAIDSNSYFVNYLAHSTNAIFEDFLTKNGFRLTNGTIDLEIKKALDQHVAHKIQPIEYGIVLHFSSKQKERQLYNLLQKFGFDPSIYIINIKEHECLLDYRILGLLYDYLQEQIFDGANGPINNDDLVHAHWLKREGEETYVYYSDDELITKVAEISFAHSAQSEYHVLCPISPKHNTFIPRLCYHEVLQGSLEIRDSMGYPVDIKEGKRIIHFCKMPRSQAMNVYEAIVKSDPERYYNLKTLIERTKAITGTQSPKDNNDYSSH